MSKFYGEVLGINRVTLRLEPGITGLVGPNGSGKSTLMNLMTGLLRPSEGEVRVLDRSPRDPELFRRVGYLTQFDSFPSYMNGFEFIYSYLRVHGYRHVESEEMARKALHVVDLEFAADRKMGSYSKGMRQRIRLAQVISHEPRVLVLDEPLNGLDPLARSSVIDVFKAQAERGCHLVISSHILHEVDMISDQVVLLSGGYVVAEGDVDGVRSEVHERPIQVLVRCDKVGFVAARLFEEDLALEVTMHEDGQGLLLRTPDAGRFYDYMNRLVLEHDVMVEAITVADSDVRAVYSYLIEQEGDS
ncbi:MAG: ABC transporter ATP-binding protein [Thermoanaerobaculia bacterium]|nr:ABC transporter ATP-binding protein [Thermoanaerobaculia bacterium]